MDKNKLFSLRFKTLLTIFIVILFIGGARTFDDYQRNSEILKNKINEINISIENSYLQKLKNVKEVLLLSGEILSNSKEVKTLIKENNREKLYDFSLTYFNSLKKLTNNQNIKMHYHLSNHYSFLRMHKPNIYGDNLENIRPIISETIFQKESLNGFEYGKHDKNQITYRVTFPIFDETNRLISVLEIGLDFNNIVREIEKEFEKNGKKVYLVQRMKEEGVINFDDFENFSLNINQCLYKKSETITPILEEYIRIKNSEVSVDGLIYSLSFDKLKITDFSFNELGSFVYIVDITKDIKENKSYFYISLSKPIIAIIIILILVYFIFQYLFTQINKMENRTNNILNAQKSIIVLTNGKSLLDCNQALLKYYGYDSIEKFKKEKECICNTFEEGKEYLQKFNDGKFWIDYMLENKNRFFKVLIKDMNQNENIFTISLSKFDENYKSKDVYYVATLTNITELEKVNIQLIEQSKQASLGEMMGNIAHQWRQPLSTISTAASAVKLYLEMDLLKKDDLDDKMSIILEKTKYLSETIDIFRNFLREKKETKEVVLQNRIDIAISIVDSMLIDNHIKLIKDIDYSSEIKSVMVVGELTQVLINIINNAKDILVEKKVESPKIIISLKKDINRAIITVEDNGGGIPENILPKIFEPYFTTKHQAQGTGLGLHMSYKIVKESLEGNIYAKNTDMGAKFFIEIPLNIN